MERAMAAAGCRGGAPWLMGAMLCLMDGGLLMGVALQPLGSLSRGLPLLTNEGLELRCELINRS